MPFFDFLQLDRSVFATVTALRRRRRALREGRYADEDAIGKLWKGQRFPMSTCISGWAW